MIKLSLKHKLRLFVGIHGLIPGYGYCFGNFEWIPRKNMRIILCNFMHSYGNIWLNSIIGYKEGDWKLL